MLSNLITSEESHYRGKKILMLFGDYVEDHEVMIPFQALQMAGHAVEAICHGAQVLAAVLVLNGRSCSAYSESGRT